MWKDAAPGTSERWYVSFGGLNKLHWIANVFDSIGMALKVRSLTDGPTSGLLRPLRINVDEVSMMWSRSKLSESVRGTVAGGHQRWGFCKERWWRLLASHRRQCWQSCGPQGHFFVIGRFIEVFYPFYNTFVICFLGFILLWFTGFTGFMITPAKSSP